MLLSFIVYASQENGMGDAGGVAMKKKIKQKTTAKIKKRKQLRTEEFY